MIVAAETFLDPEHGVIHRGERVADHHELVRKYPTKFTVERASARQAQRDGAFGLTLKYIPRRVICDELWQWSLSGAFGEGCETGGGLFASASGRYGIVVTEASVAGADSTFGRGYLALDRSELQDFGAVRRWLNDPKLQLVGQWHTHPDVAGRADDGLPSQQDVDTWRSRVTGDTSQWVGLIVTSGQHNWTKPKFHGYLITSDKVAPIAVKNV